MRTFKLTALALAAVLCACALFFVEPGTFAAMTPFDNPDWVEDFRDLLIGACGCVLVGAIRGLLQHRSE